LNFNLILLIETKIDNSNLPNRIPANIGTYLNLILKPVLRLINDLYYLKFLLKGTLDEGPREKVWQNGPILLDKSHKPIQANLKWHLHGIILKEIQLVQINKLS
jgi:hypothetical protein